MTGTGQCRTIFAETLFRKLNRPLFLGKNDQPVDGMVIQVFFYALVHGRGADKMDLRKFLQQGSPPFPKGDRRAFLAPGSDVQHVEVRMEQVLQLYQEVDGDRHPVVDLFFITGDHDIADLPEGSARGDGQQGERQSSDLRRFTAGGAPDDQEGLFPPAEFPHLSFHGTRFEVGGDADLMMGPGFQLADQLVQAGKAVIPDLIQDIVRHGDFRISAL